jgi:mannose-1-phosphate guanylyltransferase
MRAVILAGGQGTRLRPLTDNRPKPLVPFMGMPYARGLLERLEGAGVDQAVFLVGQEAEPFRPLETLSVDVRVRIVTEERPLDTAGAARRLFRGARDDDAPTLVCNGDILTDLDYADLLRAHAAHRATATLALTRVEDTSAFGVVVTDADGTTRAFVEKPEPGTLDVDTVNAGTYVLSADAFDAFPGDGPLSFERDVFPTLLETGRTVVGVPSDAHWADLGTPRRYLDGHRAVLHGRCHWPTPLERRPLAVAVHPTAQLDPRSRIGPNAVIGAGASVEGHATVTDSVLLEDVRVGSGAVVIGAVLGVGASVAAGAVAGPGTVLADGARLG